MIELTPEQRQALDEQHGQPVRVVDPSTHDAYVLVRAEVFERMTGVTQAPGEPHVEIPPQLLRSQQAFWRDLPGLLENRQVRGKWTAYHGDERIGVAATDDELIRECLRRGLGKDDYYLDVIEPMAQPPWLLVEDVGCGLAEYNEESAAPSS